MLDLYAGSGALGIEALSRGAAAAVFVDRDRAATEAVRANLTALGERGEVAARDALDYLRSVAGERRFDLVFCDPPYDSALAVAPSLAELLPAVLYDTSVTVTESDTRTPLDLPFPVVRERAYGEHQDRDPPWRRVTAGPPSCPGPTTRSPWATWTSSPAPPRCSTT